MSTVIFALKCALLTQSLILTAATVFAQEYYNSPDGNPFLDAAFQDYVETVYGYRNSVFTKAMADESAAARPASDLRDALTSLSDVTLGSALAGRRSAGPASAPGVQTGGDQPPGKQVSARGAQGGASGSLQTATGVVRGRDRLPDDLIGSGRAYGPQTDPPVPGQYYKVTFAKESGPLSAFVAPLDHSGPSGFKFEDYVFVSILPASADYSGLPAALSETGFKFAGEKTYFHDLAKKTFLLGWVPYSKLSRICGHPGVRRVAIEEKSSGAPLKTRIRFTLRAPSGERSGDFVSGFLKELNVRAGFASESVVRLSRDSAHAKFTGFDVTGSLPMDMIGTLARSPFVVAVEFADNPL